MNSKEYRRARVLAAQQGWTVEHTRGGHERWLAPDGAIVIMASTPSDKRAWLNARAALRRAGLEGI